MSLIQTMRGASAFRRNLRKMGAKFGSKTLANKSKTSKRKGLRGGVFAKKAVLDTDYLLRALDSVGKTKIKPGGFKPFGIGRSKGLAARGAARAQFAKRYPKTDMALGASGYVAAGGIGAWLADDD
jgi:hypothetical protein|tara:strand:- start:763 stop:1140 length:378 start_codon:yes stop_codon:yes gene_type:complete